MYSMDTTDNYYAILGVPIDADSETLKRAYRQLARRYHPDLAGPVLHSGLGVISVVSSVQTAQETLIALGSLDGKGFLWHPQQPDRRIPFAADPAQTIESLKELRFSVNGGLLAGWGRLSLHVWDTNDGSLLWSYPLIQRAVSAHYSLDVVLQEAGHSQREAIMA